MIDDRGWEQAVLRAALGAFAERMPAQKGLTRTAPAGTVTSFA
ncbi:hypothetical protein Q8F57_018510 [Paraburkholderia terrae]